MKKLFRKPTTYFYTVLVAVFLAGCKQTRTTVENFCGGVVYEKGTTVGNDKYFVIKQKNKFSKVFVYELEHKQYKVADTIKNCH